MFSSDWRSYQLSGKKVALNTKAEDEAERKASALSCVAEQDSLFK